MKSLKMCCNIYSADLYFKYCVIMVGSRYKVEPFKDVLCPKCKKEKLKQC